MPAKGAQFRVREVFPMSFMDEPYVVGRFDGDFAVGDRVELRRTHGSIVAGVVSGLVVHGRNLAADQITLVFGGDIASCVQPGDLIVKIDRGDGDTERMLAGYRPLLAEFLAGSVSAEEFERRFLAYFKADHDQVLGPEFDVLDGLVGDVDAYVAADDLRARVGGLDEDGLRAAVQAAYQVLYEDRSER